MSKEAVRELKIRLLDSLGCAIGAQQGKPIKMIRKQIEDFGGNPLTSLIGGGRTVPDRAALYNSVLIRYFDYNDSYLSKKETCHPSDHAGSILAAAEYADKNGNDFLTALAIAYQVQCGLSDVAPMRDKDFDHTVQGAYGTAAGVAFALGLDADKTAHAIAISGTAHNALRMTRTGNLSHWKGLAFPSTGWTSTHSAFLAMQGITGPEEIFEGNKGFKEAIEGEFTIDWQKEDLEKVKKTIIKKYNAEIHSQSIQEGVQELVQSNSFSPDDIEKIDLNTFNVAYHIIGGGEEGSKENIHTKEEADHSLPYMIAAMILDGNVLPAQYLPEWILKEEFQKLLTRVQVKEMKAYSDLFPNAMACDLTIYLKNGRQLHVDKKDYEGFFTQPASRETVICKFKTLCNPFVDEKKSDKIIATVKDLEKHNITELMETLRTLK